VAARRARPARRPAARSQHFLRSSLASAIVREARVGPDDLVLDLGAGSGRLTGALARAARRVVAVELDPHLAASLRGGWPDVEVVEADAALVDLPTEPFRVVANLPFDRTTSILHHLLDDPAVPLERADLVVEWSVAVKRSLPWPSSVNGVVWGAWYRATLLRHLAPGAFEPCPSVAAGLVAFERRHEPLVDPSQADAYRTFVASGFRRGLRRGQPRLPRNLRGLAPRDLDAHRWAELFGETARIRRAPGRRSG
jgi:23S rRNA (adenine-N6)-dimethyltransferase